jgi:hypothetical protein
LHFTGHLQGEQPGVFDEATRQALVKLVRIENLEQRWDGAGELVDRDVLEYLRYD